MESLEQRNLELSDNRVAYAGGDQATRAEGGAELAERAVVDREARILRLLPAHDRCVSLSLSDMGGA